MQDHLRSSDSTSGPRATLPGVQSRVFPSQSLRTLLHNLLALGQDELDVARVGHVRVDTTVSAVCPPSLLRCLVDLDVLDNESAGVEALGVGVRFGVAEKVEKVAGGLVWPAGAVSAELLA